MQYGSSWEINIYSASEEIIRFLRHPATGPKSQPDEFITRRFNLFV